jgi:hypothetical protein
MFREYLGKYAPTWIGDLSTVVTVFCCAIGLLVAWYVLTDRRRAYQERMQAMPLDDGLPLPQENHHG